MAIAIDAGDPCEAQVAQVQQSYDAYQKAMADQQLEPAEVTYLPVPFRHWRGGARPPADYETKQLPARRSFENKKTGDRVKWRDEGRSYEGIYLDTHEAWTIMKRGDKLFAVRARTTKAITCENPAAFSGGCFSDPHDPAAIALPEHTTFGGTITIDVDVLRLDVKGSKRPPCPA